MLFQHETKCLKLLVTELLNTCIWNYNTLVQIIYFLFFNSRSKSTLCARFVILDCVAKRKKKSQYLHFRSKTDY